MADTPTRFDARAAFAALSPDEQRNIGEAGLLLAYAIVGKEWFGDAAAPAFETAESEAYEILLRAVRAAEIPAFDADPPAAPDLAPFAVAQCRVCGYTDMDVFRWAKPDLCSACAAEAR